MISRKSHEVAVKKVLNGEKPGPSSVLSADDFVQVESPKEKSSAPKSGGEQKKPVQNKASTNKPASTSKSTPKSSSQTKPKTPTKSTTPIKPTSTAAKKPATPTKSTTANSRAAQNQQTKVSNSRATVQKATTSQAVKRGQEKIAKPVTKPAANKPAGKANLVNQAANGRKTSKAVEEPRLVKSRTLTKEELSAVQANKQANRGEAENVAADLSETNLEAATNLNDDVGGHEEEVDGERIGKNVDTINESVSLGMANQSAMSESIADSSAQNRLFELEENGERAQGSKGKQLIFSLIDCELSFSFDCVILRAHAILTETAFSRSLLICPGSLFCLHYPVL